MKIKEVTPAKVFFIETDEEDYNFYTRYRSDFWTVRISESDESLGYCEEIEELYRLHCLENNLPYEKDA